MKVDPDPAIALPAPRFLDAGEAALVGWLKDQSERIIETACARVFLAGEVAWKVKRHADLGYADFRTLERRKSLPAADSGTLHSPTSRQHGPPPSDCRSWSP